MNNLYDALEICLKDIEQGADIETVLFRYPDLADELRPILEASRDSRGMTVAAPSAEVVRRNRAKLLQHAAEMREAKAKRSSRRFWFASVRRVAVTLAVVATLFISGTGLVRAASTTLPGDNLYPVKRTWEDVLLLFTFNLQQREELEIEHENERLHELREVLAEGRSAEVDFAGVVTSQAGNEWVVFGIPVVILAQTEIRDQGIVVGSAVRVRGQTQGNVAVFAERIELLPPGATLPDAGDESESEGENHEGSNQQNEDNSGKGSEGDSPNVEETKSPESESEQKDESSNDGSNSGSGDSGSEDNGNNSGSSSNDNSGGSDDNSGSSGSGNDNGGDDGNSNNNGNDSGGGDNSGSGGGGGD